MGNNKRKKERKKILNIKIIGGKNKKANEPNN